MSQKAFTRGKKSKLFWILGAFLFSALAACSPTDRQLASEGLNSRYTDEQPALSGNGRFLAFVTNRNGGSQIALYDLQLQRFIELPGINESDIVSESPSLSRTARFLVYLTSEQGKPQIAFYDRAVGRSEILTKNYRSWVRNPQISPSGRYIVFESSRRGQWDIEVLDRGTDIELDIPDGVPVEP